jgi:hypothetical protein
VVGHLSARGSFKGPLFSQGPWWGTWRGSFAGTCEGKRKVYLGSFSGPKGHQDLSLGAIWNLGKGTGLS